MSKFDKIFVLSIIVIFSVVAIFVMIKFSSKNDRCTDLGGALVKTSEGWACVRLERLS